MESSSLGAIRQYDIAKKALTPDMKAGRAKAEVGTEKTSAIANGAREFAQVFENVDQATNAMSAGTANAHSVVEALATAEIALETAVTIRNRVVEAYQELLRMPV